MSTVSLLDRLRQPEYTGENRCVPCTAANTVIAVVVSAAVGYGWSVAVGSLWWAAGGVVLVASLASIWLRGYLVPGTPELTKRYFPDWLLAKFDKGPAAGGTGVDAGAVDGDDPEGAAVDPESVLLSAGVVEPCEHEDDLCLDGQFRANWRDRMRAIREDGTERAELAREFDLDPEEVEFDDYGGAFVVRHGGTRVGQWESRAALVADLAAARELPGWVDGWGDFPAGTRGQLLGGLRIFADECPVCEGPVTAGMETVQSCCRSHEVVAATCEACDSRLLEVPYDEEAMA